MTMLDPQDLKPGEAQWEEYRSRVTRRDMVQYDYRDEDGELYSTVRPSLALCEQDRRTWQRIKRGAIPAIAVQGVKS